MNCSRIQIGSRLWSIGGQTRGRPMSRLLARSSGSPSVYPGRWWLVPSPPHCKFTPSSTSSRRLARVCSQMLFKNPSLLAKNILRDQACCVRIGGKTGDFTTFNGSQSSAYAKEMLKTERYRFLFYAKKPPKIQQFTHVQRHWEKIRPIFQRYLICSYLILPCSHRAFFHKFQPK